MIAIKHDRLKIKEGSIYLNGESLKEPYLEGLPKTMGIEEKFDWILEDDSVIVLSDNQHRHSSPHEPLIPSSPT